MKTAGRYEGIDFEKGATSTPRAPWLGIVRVVVRHCGWLPPAAGR